MTFKKQWLLASVMATAVLAGCGGGGDSVSSFTPPQPPIPPAQTISDTVSVVIQYVQQLIAAKDETSEPIDINGLTLATDNTAEPTAI
jgi:hypothetical protein